MSAPRADHHARTSRPRASRLDLVRKQQVAVADDRHRHGGGDLADGVPVGRAAIPGVAGAPVDEDRLRAAIDRRARQIHVVAHLVVPAKPDLHGHRHPGDRLCHRVDDAANPRGLAAECRAHALPGEVVDRTAEVDVHEVGAARLDQGGSPGHLLGVGAGQLHAEAGLALEAPDQRELADSALFEPARDRHLADEHPRAEFDGQAPVRQVRALGHRRHDDGAGQRLSEVHSLTVAYRAGTHVWHF